MFGKIASDDERTILISRDKILLCKCSSKKGALYYEPHTNTYIHEGGCLENTICALIVRIKHKIWLKQNNITFE